MEESKFLHKSCGRPGEDFQLRMARTEAVLESKVPTSGEEDVVEDGTTQLSKAR